jgi:hypothetical protein
MTIGRMRLCSMALENYTRQYNNQQNDTSQNNNQQNDTKQSCN